MRGLTRDTCNEMIDRKLFWVFVAVTVLTILIVLLSASTVKTLKAGEAPPEVAKGIGDLVDAYLINGLGKFLSILVFLAVMGTAGLIPSMLSRGRAEFYMSKPISRTGLLLNKLVGMWAVYGGLTVVAGLVCLGVMVLSYDLFKIGVLWMLVDSLVALAVWFSITGLIGVISGSYAFAVTAAFLVWIAQSLLPLREGLAQIVNSKVLTTTLDILYYVLPKPSQVSDLFAQLARSKEVADWMPLWSTLLFALVMYAASLWFFRRKDY